MLLGKGELYFDRYDSSGLSTGERFLGNVEALAVNIADELVEKYSSVTHSAPLAAQALKRRTATLTITADEYTYKNMGLALMGDQDTYSQASATITAEAAKVPVLGTWFKLAKRKISAVTVKKGATTYVLGTDYVLDTDTGRVKPLTTGAMVTGDAITVDYTAAAMLTTAALNAIDIGTSSTIKGFMRFIPDPSAGPSHELELWSVQINPEGDLSGFISDDYGTFQLKAKILDDSANHPSSPLGRLIQRA
jgi:hypothetical protein